VTATHFQYHGGPLYDGSLPVTMLCASSDPPTNCLQQTRPPPRWGFSSECQSGRDLEHVVEVDEGVRGAARGHGPPHRLVIVVAVGLFAA
jgi:hypothetical protein